MIFVLSVCLTLRLCVLRLRVFVFFILCLAICSARCSPLLSSPHFSSPLLSRVAIRRSLTHFFYLHHKPCLPFSRSHKYRYYSRLLNSPAPFPLKLIPTPRFCLRFYPSFLPIVCFRVHLNSSRSCMRYIAASPGSAYDSISSSPGSACVPSQLLPLCSPFSEPTQPPFRRVASALQTPSHINTLSAHRNV